MLNYGEDFGDAVDRAWDDARADGSDPLAQPCEEPLIVHALSACDKQRTEDRRRLLEWALARVRNTFKRGTR